MAKYSVAPDDIQEIVTSVASEAGLQQIGVDFQTLVTTKGKDIVKAVKANEFTEIVSKREDLVFFLIRQDIFDEVDDKTRYMWVRMEMEKVAYDDDKGKVVIGCPTITIPISFYERYKEVAVDSALLQHYTYEQVSEKEREEKEAKKAAKKNKKQ